MHEQNGHGKWGITALLATHAERPVQSVWRRYQQDIALYMHIKEMCAIGFQNGGPHIAVRVRYILKVNGFVFLLSVN
jgi:hypothetical protein